MAQNNSDRLNDSVNSLLQAAADCTSALLSDENFERGVNEALEILGTSVGADRLAIAKYYSDETEQTLGHIVLQYEWLSPFANSQLDHPELNRINCDEFAEDHHKFILGQHCGGLIKNYPEPFRSNQEKNLGVKTVYAIPIMVNRQYWGIITLDFCQTARELCEAEIAVLKTAATCIGSAIQRERNRQSKEAAERKFLLQQQKTIELQERDRLLNLTANAAQALLDKENLDKAIANALEIIGEGIATDRVAVMEHCDNPTRESLGYLKMLYEWHSADAVSQLHHPELHQVGYEGIEDWYEQLTKGEAVGGVVSELAEPIRSGQEEIGVKSTYSVPIAIDGEYWGLIGLDNCKEAKQPNETEISILKTVATCIGSAIAQNRICQAREVAERSALLQQQKAAQLEEHNRVLEQRDRILAATAEASNVLLTETDFDEAVNRALQVIGETIDTDRATVIQHHDDTTGKTLGYVELIYEWNQTYAVSQLNNPKASRMDYEGVEHLYKLFSSGVGFGAVVDELPEPLRSIQQAIGVKSTYSIPILVNQEYWEFVGFDDCREATRRSEAELSILKTAAACIGGAIERERTRRAKESAERNILLEREQAAQERAKLLQAVATVANSLLRSPDYRTALPEVLQILGEAAKSDRCSLAENVTDPQTGEAAVKIGAEWCRQDIRASIDHTPELETALLWSYFPQFEEKLIQGETSTFLIDELSEPARSILQAQGNISLTLVPIVVQGKFWGVFSFDYCQQARLFAEADTAIFAIAVDSIAAAIEREQQDEALKASEKRYRTLFELSNEGIYRFEFAEPIPTSLSVEEQSKLGYQHYQIAEVNNTFVAQYGFNNIDEVIGKGLADFHPEDSRENNLAVIRTLIENDYQIRNAENEEISIDEKPRYFLQNVVGNVRDGYVWGGWGTQTDITELKQAQQALLEAERQRVAQLEESNQILSLRDRWLEATANAANRLLATPDLDTGINAALKVLGESLDCDRVAVMQHFEDDTGKTLGLVRQLYEWDSPGTISQIAHPQLNEISSIGAEKYFAKLQAGEWISDLIEEFDEPFRSELMQLDVKSTHAVPIFINDIYWGVIGIDFCREARRLTLPEIAVFKTAASCVGSAISRQQIQQQREQAERTIILERERAAQEKAAELTKVNAVLSRSLDKLTDTADLNSFLGQVVLEITRQVGAVCGHIFLYDDDNHTLNLRLSVRNGIIHQGAAEHDCRLFHSPVPADISPIFAYLCQTREISLLSTNYDANSSMWWEGTLEWHRQMGHQEAAAVALMIEDKPLGYLGLAFSEKSALKPEELELIYALTNQASLAIQLTNLAQQAQEYAVTSERNRMAREIHDTLAQAFTGISLQLEAAKNSLAINPEIATERLLQAKNLAKEGITEARRSVRALRPEAMELGLSSALRQLANKMLLGTKIKPEISIEGETRTLTPQLEAELFRIAQEALTNVIRHAQATEVCLQLIYEPDTIYLQIKDNGIGFDLQQLQSEGFGLLGMRERCDRLNGNLVINSVVGEGTEITITMVV